MTLREKRKLVKVARMLAEIDATRPPSVPALSRASAGTLAIQGGFAALSPQPPLIARAN